MTMLIADHRQTTLQLLQNGENLMEEIGDSDSAEAVRRAREELETRQSPTLMFYGLYNAGKSTLINAICQKEVAKTGDRPTTVHVQTVPIGDGGYTIFDTPGINARDADTVVAKDKIQESDLIFFVMDNADTFDNARVYQEIVEILVENRDLAVIINQKTEDDDEEGEASVPVDEQPSMQAVSRKILENLQIQCQRSGFDLRSKSNFIGRFPVNALDAFMAKDYDEPIHSEELRLSGLSKLVDSINDAIRKRGNAAILKTPLIQLLGILDNVAKTCGSNTIYGSKEQKAREREELQASRQRMYHALLANGRRKIEAAMERVRMAALNGQPYDNASEELKAELNQTLQEAVSQESALLSEIFQMASLPAGGNMDASTVTVRNADTGEDITSAVLTGASSTALATSGLALEIILPTLTITIPAFVIPIIIGVVASLLGRLLGNDEQDEQEAYRAAQQDQERMAAYYKFLNELRETEAGIKATWEKSVSDVLEKFYGPKIEQLDRELADVSSECESHTRNLGKVNELRSRVESELRELDATV